MGTQHVDFMPQSALCDETIPEESNLFEPAPDYRRQMPPFR
jgi:hypothetical protein